MLFNSVNFALFLPIVFLLYWFVFKNKLLTQNLFLLFASYVFYATWDWRFLFLLIFSTLLDFFSGLKIYNSSNQKWRKIWLVISVVINLGFLFSFKYYNFFSAGFATLLRSMGFEANIASLSVILPVGISFYTFHGLSYVFDIFFKKIKPTTNWVDYSLFVSFFPLLVAGPIERATHLLPQLEKKRNFDYLKAVDGLKQILWGLFKKVVIADNCAYYCNNIFNDTAHQYEGFTLVLGAIFFTFQIYGDFSGYSDIALGTAKLFGIDLLRNFAFPYFSRDIAEFWRRWHISLSSWFRDYLYVPLGGSKVSTWIKVRNTFIIFIVSGFWHGGKWKFIVWGLLNAIYIMPLIIFNLNRKNLETVAKGKIFPSIKEILQMAITFSLTVFAWIFFRADNMPAAIKYVKNLFTGLAHERGYIQAFDMINFEIGYYLPFLIFVFMVVEWLGREDKYAIQTIFSKYPKPVRWSFYYTIVILFFLFTGKSQQFIYFQF